MQNISAWLQDRKNLPIVAAGAGIVIVIAALVFLRMAGVIGGGGGGDQDMGMYPEPGTTMEDPYATEQPPTDPAAVPAAQPAQAVQTASTLGPMLPYRKDPFQPLGGRPQPRDYMLHMLPALSRPRIAPAPVAELAELVEEETLPPQPFRRMAGVMWNGRVSAILESDGQTFIVRPGMEIPGQKVRVESIHPDHIILKTLDTRTPMTIRVNMGGAITDPTGAGAEGEMGMPSPAGPRSPTQYQGGVGAQAPSM